MIYQLKSDRNFMTISELLEQNKRLKESNIMEDIREGKGLKPLNNIQNNKTNTGEKNMDDKITVTMTAQEYARLINNAERVEILKRFLKKEKYLSVSDVCNILGIEQEEKND